MRATSSRHAPAGQGIYTQSSSPYGSPTWSQPPRGEFPVSVITTASHQHANQIWGRHSNLELQAVPQIHAAPFPPFDFTPVTGSGFPPIPDPQLHSRYQFPYSESSEHASFSAIMGESEQYPLSPRSDRQPSVPTSIASASPLIMSPEQGSPISVPSRRPRATVRRDRSPPRNAVGQICCDHSDCAGKDVTFRRRCEWSKHMDKHERPWKCNEPGCETSPGFTYSGGLLRHQREVHRMYQSTRQPLFCPFPSCNRSSGTGFTRRENLEEHKRRRHLGEPAPTSPEQTSSSPASTTRSHMQPPARKRLRDAVEFERDEDDDVEEEGEGTSGSATTSTSQRLVKRLREEIARKDQIIRQQGAELTRMRHVLQSNLQLTPATTA